MLDGLNSHTTCTACNGRGFARAIFRGNQKRLNIIKGHNASSLHYLPPFTRLQKQKEEVQFLF
jgi:hypothetical protein